MSIQFALKYAEEVGFSHAGIINMAKLELRSEVREMCSTDRCGRYNTCWTCPPACGSLETLRKQLYKYSSGIIVQSTGHLEDEFDVETMLETEQIHKRRFSTLADVLRAAGAEFLSLSAGTCTVCKKCAYPMPCRYPDKAISSMEAYGILVSQLCIDSNIGYYYGKGTITYSGCFLFN